MENNGTVEQLNDLLTKAYDAEEGFAKAAERASEHPRLVSFFSDQSAARKSFGHDLKSLITKYGGEPDKGSSVAAKAHQVWITVKDTLSGDEDEEAVLEECIRGEKAAIEEYDEVLAEAGLPSDVLQVVSAQRDKVAESLSKAIREEARVD